MVSRKSKRRLVEEQQGGPEEEGVPRQSRPRLQLITSVSWYQMRVHNGEGISDLLSAAANGANADRAVDPNLVLRELGNGHGMSVPGLWEVEVASAWDVQNLIQRVRAGSASGESGCDRHHHVFTITTEEVVSGASPARRGKFLRRRQGSRC